VLCPGLGIGPVGVGPSVVARFSQRGRAYIPVKCVLFIDFALNRIFVEMFRRNTQAGKLLLESSEASVACLRARYIGLILITVSILCLTQYTMPRHCV